MTIKNLHMVIIYVQAMDKQVAFYRDVLGLVVKEPLAIDDYGDVYWVELDAGGCTLALHGGGEGRLGEDAAKLVFGVDDVPAVKERLSARGVPMGEIHSPAPGMQVCGAVDPEGNRFSIQSPA
jgi:catechol 2,3-dioxygenase-like lactoylglutathione lyase family enzyme